MRFMRHIAVWLYGVPEESVRDETEETEERIRERERRIRRRRTLDDSVATLSDEMRRGARRGR